MTVQGRPTSLYYIKSLSRHNNNKNSQDNKIFSRQEYKTLSRQDDKKMRQ